MMKKSELIKQNSLLINKLHIANLSIERLKKQVAALETEKIRLNTLLSSADDTICLLKSQTSKPKVENSESVSDFPEEIADNKNDVADGNNDTVELDADMSYASSAVGEIVMHSLKFADRLSATEKENKKELLNLLLGRTEVAKSEILNVVMSDASYDAKRSMVDSVVSETVEYYKSILEQ